MQLGLLKLNAGIGRAIEHEGLPPTRERRPQHRKLRNHRVAIASRRERARWAMERVPSGSLRFLRSDRAADVSRAARALATPARTTQQRRSSTVPRPPPAADSGAGDAAPTRKSGPTSTASTGESSPGSQCGRGRGRRRGSRAGSSAEGATRPPTERSGTPAPPAGGAAGAGGEPVASEAAPQAATPAGGTPARAPGGRAAVDSRCRGRIGGDLRPLLSSCSSSPPDGPSTSACSTAPALRKAASDQQLTYEKVPAPRGTITDHNGFDLAVSEPATKSRRPRTWSRNPAPPPSSWRRCWASREGWCSRSLRQHTGFVYLDRDLPAARPTASSHSISPGMPGTPVMHRVYPGDDLAGQVLGLVGHRRDGLGGLEYSRKRL